MMANGAGGDPWDEMVFRTYIPLVSLRLIMAENQPSGLPCQVSGAAQPQSTDTRIMM